MSVQSNLCLPHRRALLLLVLVALLVAGCRTAAPTEEDPVVDVEAEVEAEEAVADIVWHSGLPVDDQALWVLELMNERQGALTQEEMDERFHDDIHQALPYEQFAAAMGQVGAMGPFEPDQPGERPTDEVLVLSVRASDGTALLLTIAVDAQEPHKIRGLTFTPAPADEASLPQSWDEVREGLASFGGQATLLAARVRDGECHAVVDHEPNARLAIGSTFKIYVLGRLAEAVAAGEISYDDELTIDDAHKSLPSGVLQEREAGTTVDVLDAASKMISISDNTATDHLLARLGRSSVEESLARFGHGEPAATMPFLYTHEFMKLKLGVDADVRDSFVGRDLDGRRQMLRDEIRPLALPDLDTALSWSTPRHVDTIEWFASASDLCGAHSAFIANAEEPAFAQALEVLAINDGGLGLGDATYVGFKGGSEPGVINLSWLIRDEAGDWYSLTVGLNHAEVAVPLGPVHDIARGAARLLFAD